MLTLMTALLAAALLLAALPTVSPSGSVAFGPAAAEAGMLKKAVVAFAVGKGAQACTKSTACRERVGDFVGGRARALADTKAGRRAAEFGLDQLSRRGPAAARMLGNLLDRGSDFR